MTLDKLPENRPLKIAYLCDADPRDRNLYSGGNARIFDALRSRFSDVHVMPIGWGWAEPVRRLVLAMPEPLILRAKWRLHLLLSRIIARVVAKELKRQRFDVLFCAYSFHALYHLKPPYPITTVFTSDATPTVYKNSEVGQSFDSYLSLSRRFDPLIQRAEAEVFRKTDLLLWPSEWLKEEAEQAFALDPGHGQVVPWGANIADPGGQETLPKLGPGAPVRILLVGRDWFAKGGPITAEAVHFLRDWGIDARLTVVGCTPPETGLGNALSVYPSLDKAKPEELKLFQDQYRQAHFMMMPSFESYGFAFCEASAFGLPSLCARVGGVPVRDGINGFVLPPDAGPLAYAEIVRDYLSAPDQYDALRRSTRREYETRLNWDAWAEKTAALINAAVEKRES
ncbi:MAG: glycosyltransferase family 4 protein [Thalassovita sp.]|nr:glycosyltransferase family 4 protein [Thalassovita sp.]